MKTYNFLFITRNTVCNSFSRGFKTRGYLRQRTSLRSVDKSDGKLSTDKKWFSVKLGDDKDVSKDEMRKRLDDAERWDQRKLSDEDSDTLNRLLGIEKEIYEFDNAPDIKSNNKNGRDRKEKSIKSLQKLPSSSRNNELKGFLGKLLLHSFLILFLFSLILPSFFVLILQK